MTDIATATGRVRAGTAPADANARTNSEETTTVLMDERDLFLMVDRDDGDGDGDAGTAATLAQVRKAVAQGVFVNKAGAPADADRVAGLPQVLRNSATGSFHFHTGATAANGAPDEDWTTLGSVTANVASGTDGVVTEMWFGTLAQYNAITTKDPDTLYFTS